MQGRVTQTIASSDDQGMSRRHLLRTLGAAATVSLVGTATPWQAFADESKAIPATTINHLALGVTDYAKSRDWYVDLFGVRVVWDDGKQCAVEFGSNISEPNGMYIRKINPNEKPGISHFAFGTGDLMAKKAAMKAEMDRRGLTNIRPDGERGWSANDPAGYMLNTWVPYKDPAMFPGAAGPCAVAESDQCKAAFEAGMKNLASVPKPSGTGFKALYFSLIVLHVPEDALAKEKEFYSGMYGMKVLYEKGGPNPEVLLKFGQNTLYLRTTENPGDKPYSNEFGFGIGNFNQEKVEAELKRRGLNPQPNTKLGWTIHDPTACGLWFRDQACRSI